MRKLLISSQFADFPLKPSVQAKSLSMSLQMLPSCRTCGIGSRPNISWDNDVPVIFWTLLQTFNTQLVSNHAFVSSTAWVTPCEAARCISSKRTHILTSVLAIPRYGLYCRYDQLTPCSTKRTSRYVDIDFCDRLLRLKHFFQRVARGFSGLYNGLIFRHPGQRGKQHNQSTHRCNIITFICASSKRAF